MTAGIWSDSQVQPRCNWQTESNKRIKQVYETFLHLPSPGTSKELLAVWDGSVRSDPLPTPFSTPEDSVGTVTVLL